MLQAADSFPPPGRVLYVSGEETPGQLKLRAVRLGVSREVEVFCEAELERIIKVLDNLKPLLVIVDSIQTVYSPLVGAYPGVPNQLRCCCHELIEWARLHGAAVFLVAHITKEGLIAGPKVIEHMVDTVLYFDSSATDVRFLRASKNRFGSVDEIGLFTMTEEGLKEVRNPSTLFLVRRTEALPPGIATVPVHEGSRVLLMEIQALTVPAQGGLSRCSSDRIDPRRVSRIAAVLEKHIGIKFSDQDLYINVAGGINLKETGIDLALALALYSARTGLPLPGGTAAAGEISLAGEIHPIPHLDRRIKTCRELGFHRIVGPPPAESLPDYLPALSLKEAISLVFQS
jgi:DNA repair protein RadA/Sms